MRTTKRNASFTQALLLTGLLITMTGLLAACGGAPKKEELVLDLNAAADVNPDSQGRPSPIVVHVMELKSLEAFNSLDYVSLTNASGAALGPDRLNGSQVVIAPGGTLMLELELDAATTAIGVVAGYRDIDNASWRRAIPISPGQTDRIKVQLDQFQLSATTED